MKKMIRFDLPMDGVKVGTLNDLRDHFISREILAHYDSGHLARWLRSRSMTDELHAIEELTAHHSRSSLPEGVVLKELCRIFDAIPIEPKDTGAAAQEEGAESSSNVFRDFPEGPDLVVCEPGNFDMGSIDGLLARSHRTMSAMAELLGEEVEGEEDEEMRKARERGKNEMWLHEVKIGYSLAVGINPVTFEEWDACESDGGCGGYRPHDEGWGRGRRPVINVSWDDAQMYVKWLTRKTGQRYRLLSEAEWEYVARAGSLFAYCWGEEIGENRACCDGCGSHWDNSRTSPVGCFDANAFGLYDMHGNVREWVEDCWQLEEQTEDGSAVVSHDGGYRVLRGGSWADGPHDLQSARRYNMNTAGRSNKVGFRVARVIEG